jgi:hypothetical protein
MLLQVLAGSIQLGYRADEWPARHTLHIFLALDQDAAPQLTARCLIRRHDLDRAQPRARNFIRLRWAYNNSEKCAGYKLALHAASA